MYRFALRPRWIVSHLFALSLVVLFVNLGLWQLDRHDQRAERNQAVQARSELPADPVAGILSSAAGEELRFRPATAEGTYLTDADLLVDNRSHEGLPGAWTLTPMELDDGSVLVVSRGFQGSSAGTIEPAPPPSGAVRIEGTLVPWDGRDCGVRTDDAGDPVGMACLRRSAAEEVAGGEVLPVVLQVASSTPADADVLTPVPLPELDAGPHRSYAVQWFIFAAIGTVGYPLILRRVARDRAGAADRPDDLDAELADLLAAERRT